VGRFLAVTALACASVVLVAAASAADPPGFVTDHVGDAGTASDIAAIRVANNVEGTYNANTWFATPLTRVSSYIVYFDLDRDEKTGSPGGAEFLVGHCRGELLVERWNGHQWGATDAEVHELVSPDRKFVGFAFDKSAIGGDEDFDVFANSKRMDASDDLDIAPDEGGAIHYTFSHRATIAITSTATTPARAGGTWTVGVLAARSDTNASLDSGGKITCKGTVGATPLPIAGKGYVPVTRNDGGHAMFPSCQFRIAKSLKHRTLRATVRVTWRGSTVRHTFTTTAT
jgi:hypothetical protein